MPNKCYRVSFEVGGTAPWHAMAAWLAVRDLAKAAGLVDIDDVKVRLDATFSGESSDWVVKELQSKAEMMYLGETHVVFEKELEHG